MRAQQWAGFSRTSLGTLFSHLTKLQTVYSREPEPNWTARYNRCQVPGMGFPTMPLFSTCCLCCRASPRDSLLCVSWSKTFRKSSLKSWHSYSLGKWPSLSKHPRAPAKGLSRPSFWWSACTVSFKVWGFQSSFEANCVFSPLPHPAASHLLPSKPHLQTQLQKRRLGQAMFT